MSKMLGRVHQLYIKANHTLLFFTTYLYTTNRRRKNEFPVQIIIKNLFIHYQGGYILVVSYFPHHILWILKVRQVNAMKPAISNSAGWVIAIIFICKHKHHSRYAFCCRGVNTWKPQVTPLAEVKTTPEGVPVATATSLAANKQVSCHGDYLSLYLVSRNMD